MATSTAQRSSTRDRALSDALYTLNKDLLEIEQTILDLYQQIAFESDDQGVINLRCFPSAAGFQVGPMTEDPIKKARFWARVGMIPELLPVLVAFDEATASWKWRVASFRRRLVGEFELTDDAAAKLLLDELSRTELSMSIPGLAMVRRKLERDRFAQVGEASVAEAAPDAVERARVAATAGPESQAGSDGSVARIPARFEAGDAYSPLAKSDTTAQERRSHFKRCMGACKEIVLLKSTPKQPIVAFIAGVGVREFGAYLGNEKKKDGSNRLSGDQIDYCRQAVELLSDPDKAAATLQTAYNRARKESDSAVLRALTRAGFRPSNEPDRPRTTSQARQNRQNRQI